MPDCYSIENLSNWTPDISGLVPPAKLAVIGDPVAHSKSPQMHNPALRACGLDAQYIRVHVRPGEVARSLRLFAERGFKGVNVTIPHKLEALESVDVLEPQAQCLGAVNTVAIREGKLHGFNSDGPGFLRAVKEAFGVDVSDLRVLILGAGGGAGRAVAVQCALEKCPRLILVNRTADKAAALAQQLTETSPSTRVTSVAWELDTLRAALDEADLVVNGTSLGMKPDDAPLLPPASLTGAHRAFDMVYRAGGQLTQLGAAAHAAGAAYVDGSSLLLHQGAISFEYWFGIPAPTEVMRAGLTTASNP